MDGYGYDGDGLGISGNKYDVAFDAMLVDVEMRCADADKHTRVRLQARARGVRAGDACVTQAEDSGITTVRVPPVWPRARAAPV